MKNLAVNSAPLKLMLIIAIGLYGLLLLMLFNNYGGLKQNIYEEFIR